VRQLKNTDSALACKKKMRENKKFLPVNCPSVRLSEDKAATLQAMVTPFKHWYSGSPRLHLQVIFGALIERRELWQSAART
jgi:hypothetical protein